ncbi:MAG: lipid-binding SYLF domain-containing protein [Proteobacteria bacterium]|nr:lipid-binding SYLF domain-containing protein [Pseudomonadota bacterium]
MIRLVTLLVALVLGASPARAINDAELLVDKAKGAVEAVLSEPNYSSVRERVQNAWGVLIIPQLVKAGFFLGGEGGMGVLLAQNPRGTWSSPAFYTVAAGSIGLQFGVQSQEMLFVVVTEKGMNSLLSTQVKLGGDVSIAVGPMGAGLAASTVGSPGADILAYAKSVGLFGGASLEGAVIKPSESYNEMYYGQKVSPREILIDRRVHNPQADSLKTALGPK